MASNCKNEAALEMEVVSFLERVLLTRQQHQTPQEYTVSIYLMSNGRMLHHAG